MYAVSGDAPKVSSAGEKPLPVVRKATRIYATFWVVPDLLSRDGFEGRTPWRGQGELVGPHGAFRRRAVHSLGGAGPVLEQVKNS